MFVRRFKTKPARYLVVTLSFIILISMGLCALYYQFIGDIRQQLSTSTSKAVQLLDQVFSYADKAGEQVVAESGGLCDADILVLREKVALVPFVRAITLVNDRGVYFCSSLLGDVSYDGVLMDRSDYYHDKLHLMPGNDILSNHPLVIYKKDAKNLSALVSIDSDYIKIIMNISNDDVPIEFRVGSKSLNNYGEYNAEIKIVNSVLSSDVKSDYYPYSIHSHIGMNDLLIKFKEKYALIIIFLIAISFLIAGLISHVLGKPFSYTDQMTLALHNGEFIPYFQPLIESSTNKVIGAEVLMRWSHPDDGVVPPDVFIPQAEASGLIVHMTSRMMSDVANIIKSNKHIFPDGFHMAFNITSEHLQLDSLINDCIHFQALCGGKCFLLVLELTERSILDYSDDVMKRLESLSSIGVELALDDFGTGHSSLITLQTFNFNCIKIDRSFISRVDSEPESRYIVDSVIALAKKLNLSIVAEGIETKFQEEYLRGSDVDYLQGYLYSRPLEVKAFLKYMYDQGLNGENKL
ncbi:TPA: EAL domain-containing protein [Aeromonas veronii]